jgi:hypothetical protein
MTSPKQFRLGLRDYLILGVAIAIAMGPSFVIDAYTPSGQHLRAWLPALVGAIVGLPCGLVLVLALRRVVRNRLYHPVLALMFMLGSLVGTGPSLVRYANRALDDSPRVARTLTVLHLSRRSKGPDRITVEHWEPGAASFTIDGQEQPGARLNVYTHSGFLGFAWIELPDDDDQNRRRGMIP